MRQHCCCITADHLSWELGITESERSIRLHRSTRACFFNSPFSQRTFLTLLSHHIKKKKSQSTLLFLFFDDYVCASLQSRHMKKDCLLSFTYLILHFFFCLLLFDRLCIDAQYVKRSMTSKTDRRKRREDEKKKEEKKKAVSHRKHDNKEGRRLNKWRTIVVFLLIEYLCYHRGKKDEGEMVQSHVPKTERLQAKKKKDGE